MMMVKPMMVVVMEMQAGEPRHADGCGLRVGGHGQAK